MAAGWEHQDLPDPQEAATPPARATGPAEQRTGPPTDPTGPVVAGTSSGEVGDPASGAVPPELAELYDDETLAAIESWARRRVAGTGRAVPGDAPTDTPIEPAGRRDPRTLGAGGAMLAAALFGLADALEPEKVRPHQVEVAPEPVADDQPVSFHLVPGDPRNSLIIVRPWLLPPA